ncbi:unnamed protein product [Fraxinus pennsylvanica]|uniref:BHLH domain-containing protein n=1 Tax=Fraxinus pennsylvanica TaxID=56036 RepID=A0AAD2A9T4_9LAMI|nr:unnamed protein product [Fraxinus pennsylvanica]
MIVQTKKQQSVRISYHHRRRHLSPSSFILSIRHVFSSTLCTYKYPNRSHFIWLKKKLWRKNYSFKQNLFSAAAKPPPLLRWRWTKFFFNGVYAGLTFHSLLMQDQTPPLPPFLESSLNYDPNGYPATEIQNLKIPKTEHLFFNVNCSVSSEVPQYNFFSNTTPSVAESDVLFPQLPGLLSLELPQHKHFQLAASSPSNSVEPAESATHSEKSYHQHRFGPYRSPRAVAPSSTLARQRRQRISDKTRCLQKLLPWDKMMDMTTMLEETYKYIKFLQAQISVLQSMPKCCVYSVDQLNMLQNIAESNGLFHHMHGI